MSLPVDNLRQMSLAILALSLFTAITLVLHLASVTVAIRRCRSHPPEPAPSPDAVPVSIVLPVCGLDNYLEDTLRSAFRLDYPRYELIFCVARPDDAAVPLVNRMMADHRWIDARLLVGGERISENPKLNNVFKGWREAAYPFVSICDSNVLLPRDYIQQLLRQFDPQTGLVCSPPIGCRPDGFFAEEVIRSAKQERSPPWRFSVSPVSTASVKPHDPRPRPARRSRRRPGRRGMAEGPHGAHTRTVGSGRRGASDRPDVGGRSPRRQRRGPHPTVRSRAVHVGAPAHPWHPAQRGGDRSENVAGNGDRPDILRRGRRGGPTPGLGRSRCRNWTMVSAGERRLTPIGSRFGPPGP